MIYKIRFHPEVATDLQTIAEIVANHSGITEATHKIIQIREAAFSLASNPMKDSAKSEAGSAVRVVPAGRKGIVAFEIDKDTATIFVLAVAYGGVEWISKIDVRKEKLISVCKSN